mmetsp:Transcript_12091/g.21838  ORF Transcript_12091/g.21838 Transcript_12091/m.21838 type:complete len:222 (-) Transcript_12091:1871-2536(-)
MPAPQRQQSRMGYPIRSQRNGLGVRLLYQSSAGAETTVRTRHAHGDDEQGHVPSGNDQGSDRDCVVHCLSAAKGTFHHFFFFFEFDSRCVDFHTRTRGKDRLNLGIGITTQKRIFRRNNIRPYRSRSSSHRRILPFAHGDPSTPKLPLGHNRTPRFFSNESFHGQRRYNHGHHASSAYHPFPLSRIGRIRMMHHSSSITYSYLLLIYVLSLQHQHTHFNNL